MPCFNVSIVCVFCGGFLCIMYTRVLYANLKQSTEMGNSFGYHSLFQIIYAHHIPRNTKTHTHTHTSCIQQYSRYCMANIYLQNDKMNTVKLS